MVNFTSTQSLFNPSLKQFLKAAKIDWKAQSFDVQDKRAEVILDAALSYAQLIKPDRQAHYSGRRTNSRQQR